MAGRTLPGACRSLCAHVLRSREPASCSLSLLRFPVAPALTASSAHPSASLQGSQSPQQCQTSSGYSSTGLPPQAWPCCNPSLKSPHRPGSSQSALAAAATASDRAASRATLHDEPEPDLTEEQRAELDRLADSIASESEDFDEDDWFTEEREAEQGEVAEEKLSSKAERKKRSWSDRYQSVREIPFEALPKVAVIGRPNVGKSALFNRITGSNKAIVFNEPGVTRDRLYTRAEWTGHEFALVDTGGLMSSAAQLPTQEARVQASRDISAAGLPSAIERQAAAGVQESHSIIMVVDGKVGLTAGDEEIIDWLRKSHSKKPVVLAVNKCESPAKADLQAAEFWNMGLEPFPVSAISGAGTGEMLDSLVTTLPEIDQAEIDVAAPISVAIIGRPNVGKSSLLNALVGQERSIVSSLRGTTRDAIDTELLLPDGRQFKLVDTAGIRKRAAIASGKDGAETLSASRAMGAIRRGEVAVLVIDAIECTESGRFVVPTQDFRLAELIANVGRACVVVVNKWDAVEKETNTLRDYQKEVLAQLRPVSWATVVFTSAVTKQRVMQILDAASAASENHRRRISTATLNMVVKETVAWRAPPQVKNSYRKGRIYYATQAAASPPTFVMFVNDAKLFSDDYRRYFERQLRDNIGFPGTPIRIFWRGKQSQKDRD